MAAGYVYWITGLSGAGKTTLAHALVAHLRTQRDGVVLLDGDELREVFGHHAHTEEDRRVSRMRNARLSLMLARQGLDVVCATISMRQDVWEWNRANIPRYREIYLRVPMSVLTARDDKGIYGRARKGELENVWGVDLAYDEPVSPDLIVDNHGALSAQEALGKVIAHFGLEAVRP